MRLRVTELQLGGTSRTIRMAPGLNVISGPITTGKTTTLRLMRMLLGGNVSALPTEVRERVPGIRGTIVVGDEAFEVYRPLVGAATARVEVAGREETWRLPTTGSDTPGHETYSDWLLAKLGLPRLHVASAPTRPDSDPTPVTLTDYMNYCVLSDRDIDSAVFGHDDPFRNIKRKYVFQILYGIYSIETAALQERYRELSAERNRLVRATESLATLLRDTPWENRALLVRERGEVEAELGQIYAQEAAHAQGAPLATEAQVLRTQVQELEREIDGMARELSQEEASALQLTRLGNQLETQSSRLTRAIVAETRLLDFEFVVCPRCGSAVDDGRGDAQRCRLCLQPPARTDDRTHLIEEQNRLGLQIAETRELIGRHQDAADGLRARLASAVARRRALAEDLNRRTSAYVSDQASGIARRASDRARTEERLRRLQDYSTLFSRLDAALAQRSQLDVQLAAIEEQLAREMARNVEVERRMSTLDRNFAQVLDRLDVPRFADPPSAVVDRQTFLPRVDGRSFETASQGMKVLINVAHALAHQLTAIEENLALPNLLIIDALSSNLGHGGYDESVRERLYDYLVDLSAEHGERLQVVVADNDVPLVARDFVRLQLDRHDMLVPPATA